MSFGYDANGRMVKATKAHFPDALSVYDALGNRVATKVNDLWQFVIYDAFGKLVAEYGGMNSSDEGGVKYVLSDWQGSVRASVSNSGYVKSRMDYQAFGEVIQSGVGLRTAAQGFGGGMSTRQGYGLTEKDDSTGLNHTWFRKNENRAGRWTNPDPYNGSMSLGDSQSWNRYSYVGNDPANYVDPSGLLRIMQCTRTWVDYGDGSGRHYSPWVCNVIYDDGGGGGGSPAPLTAKENKKLDKRIEKIKKQLKKEKCKRFLESHGISLSDLYAQLGDQSKRFSALRSTNITYEEAGLGGPNARQDAESLPPGQARNSALTTLTVSVSSWFTNAWSGNVGAAVGSGGRVFYKNFNSVTTILHENLHVSTGLGDIDLANKLGLTHNGTIAGASQAISAALRANGCT